MEVPEKPWPTAGFFGTGFGGVFDLKPFFPRASTAPEQRRARRKTDAARRR